MLDLFLGLRFSVSKTDSRVLFLIFAADQVYLVRYALSLLASKIRFASIFARNLQQVLVSHHRTRFPLELFFLCWLASGFPAVVRAARPIGFFVLTRV
jgi:hypothetical protein